MVMPTRNHTIQKKLNLFLFFVEIGFLGDGSIKQKKIPSRICVFVWEGQKMC